MAKMRFLRILIGLAFILSAGQVMAQSKPPLTVVESVDLQRYLGKWYEIASYPAWFQKGCTGSTAEYVMMSDGRIQVINRCRKKRLDGPLKESQGKAEVVDTKTNAKLKVWFFWPFKGDYWIIELDDEYRYAVVGEPGRKYLWILSRTAIMDETVYQGILSRLPQKGYDPGRLRRTAQPSN
jgi:apolipoprotein D and lipocalin family protein